MSRHVEAGPSHERISKVEDFAPSLPKASILTALRAASLPDC